MILCLNCGEWYENVCPNMGDEKHTMHHAALIVEFLMDVGIRYPTSAQVRMAVTYVDLISGWERRE